MGREIKFRAWNTKSKRMFSAEEMAEDQLTLLPTGQFINVSSISTSLSVIYPIETMIPLQYTGMKDKNGKEIYDCDIVLINHPEDHTGDFTNKRGRVFWWESEGGWYHGHAVDNGKNWSGRPPKRMWEYCEVIGNTYENPELLEV